MQEHDREQDPASRSSGEETLSYGISGEPTPADWSAGREGPGYEAGREAPRADSPAYGAASQQPPAYGTGSDQPGYSASSPQTDAFWISNQQAPSYGAGSGGQSGYGAGSQPGYGAGSQQPPPYPGSWQPPGAGNWPPPPGSPFGQWGTPPPPPRKRGRRALAFAVVAIIGVGIGAAASFGLANNSQQSSSSPGASAIPTPGSSRAPLQNTGTSNINAQAISNAVSPSVVDVTSKLTYSNETAEGTGIVISSSGLVLTNNHVVNGATNVTAQIDGAGRTYTARILGTDKTDDVSLLQLEGASGLKAASIGDSSKVAVGDPVVALGNQGGQGGSPAVTSGAITGVNKSITAGDEGSSDTETLHGMLQTDAYIAAGDSGGPLVNSSGQVIGMDTAASSNGGSSGSFGGGFGGGSSGGSGGGSGGSQGSQGGNTSQGGNIGFAIPVNNALSIAKQIAAGQSSSTIQIGTRGFLGVGVQDISTGCDSGFGNLAPGGGTGGGGSTAPASSGALVCQVYNGTPAQSAGVAAGDVITRVNGTTVSSAQSLTTAMQSKRPGNSVSLTWVDTSGQQHTATVTLTAGPAG